MKLHITVTDDKRKRTCKAKSPKKAKTPKVPKAKKPAKTKKNINWKKYWAERKAKEKKQATTPVGGNNEKSK